jgi:flagellar basal-body rod protein FlgB
VELFTDLVTSAVERALSGVAERQRVTANNIANATTPNFKAGRVSFETDLATAINRGDASHVSPSLTGADTPAKLDGNNVAVDEEMKIMVTSGLQYQALVQALNYKLGVIRTAVGS